MGAIIAPIFLIDIPSNDITSPVQKSQDNYNASQQDDTLTERIQHAKPAFQLSSFPAFQLSSFPAFQLSSFPAFQLSSSLARNIQIKHI
ncbi:MAG: hypothetical protein Q7T36_12715 [Fluviicoccus sp.]|uniref:hypothetical protein n=1 Tax=Fluviicoccus sp. TaxID=2003552 RepID=UPI0027234ED1|nr:hypothetical protein [Fluviicoccus sp.]MDO8331323.1 hypothetical protein [Fluviicoccus sp.]